MTHKRPILYTHNYESPIGTLFIAVDRRGAAVRVGYMDDPTLGDQYDIERNPYACGELAYELDEYFHGDRKRFSMEMVLEGTEFQLSVWNRLLKIPFGTVMTYGEVAQKVGRRNAARAVGNAVAQNSLPILVPCHRVLPASGKIGQYALRSPSDATGAKVKAFLLDLEQRSLQRESPRDA